MPRSHPLSVRTAVAAALALQVAAAPSTPPAAPARAGPAARTVELTLTAAPARLALRDGGDTTDVWAYDGRVPGPTLDLREGDRVVVHFRNRLPEASTIHWHGLTLPFVADGSPFHPVPPGGSHDYVFTVPRGTAGTYWYHPHPDHRTGAQVARGLYGAIVVRAPDDPLPASLPEHVLVLSDNRFRPGGAIDIADPASPAGRVDAENGREGDVVFVSGRVMPALAIRSGEVQRWRIVNASAARVYRLALEGHRLLHVGSDGGLFARGVERGELTLGVGERAEVLVRGTGAPGTRALLRALPYDRYIPQTRPADWATPRDLLALRYDDGPPVAPPALPEVLRPVAPLDTGRVAARRVMVLTQHLINGKHMDMARVDVRARLGTTEIWEVENLVGMDHPFHLHGFRFQVLDRNGVPEPFPSWKDVVNVPKHETARFVVRFDGFAGKWMYHCHILDHEDHGMMGVLEVRP
ncbi:multicopper oxidase family protein [Roseisolibacter sp. H3M3-2]|uniref:multicopper oxidase family protein n=1 Tax=Roseisolibacter sp. H3M3-2 TaxID=3031323 RepID=UPI0023DC0599|nr:multicopper oxidase family protein [Roseisolibacter sp. H3M3-2]MDF1505372.1 multicopper oxidase family protein [Roseisolibacter sp. H3M3-2]